MAVRIFYVMRYSSLFPTLSLSASERKARSCSPVMKRTNKVPEITVTGAEETDWLEVAQQLADMLRSRPVHTWKEDIAGADSLVNNYLLTFVKTSTLRTT